MNKKGFTIVELIVSFSLAATIGFFLLRITMVTKDLYTDSYVKTNMMAPYIASSNKPAFKPFNRRSFLFAPLF